VESVHRTGGVDVELDLQNGAPLRVTRPFARRIGSSRASPLVNALEWTRFVQVALLLAESRSASPTDVLVRTGLSNVEAPANSRPDIDVDDPRRQTISA
jgi:hypothetical protein